MSRTIYISILTVLLSCLTFSETIAQTGFGLRFASDLNYFNRPQDYQLADGWFTTGIFGVFFRSYNLNGGLEAGLNLVRKSADDRGFPNLPVVMDDFQQGQSVGITSLEFDMKVGPSIYPVNPKFGYIIGYRFIGDGFFKDSISANTLDINRWYLALPFGASIDLPTNYGTVGVGAYYDLGITNVIKNPDPTLGIHDGGRLRSINIEITVTYSVRELEGVEDLRTKGRRRRR